MYYRLELHVKFTVKVAVKADDVEGVCAHIFFAKLD